MTDVLTEASVLEDGGPWSTVEEALDWARLRASQIVLTYGFSFESVFSAGSTYYEGGDAANPLAVWPPQPEARAALDRDVAERAAAAAPPGSGDRISVAEPELRLPRRAYLVVYDYGMGGVWAYVRASSPAEVADTFPELTVVESLPDWLAEGNPADHELPVEDLDQPGDFLNSILAERSSS